MRYQVGAVKEGSSTNPILSSTGWHHAHLEPGLQAAEVCFHDSRGWKVGRLAGSGGSFGRSRCTQAAPKAVVIYARLKLLRLLRKVLHALKSVVMAAAASFGMLIMASPLGSNLAAFSDRQCHAAGCLAWLWLPHTAHSRLPPCHCISVLKQMGQIASAPAMPSCR